jgi:hypothetical protein
VFEVAHEFRPDILWNVTSAYIISTYCHISSVVYPGILFGGKGGLTNSVEDRGQRERGFGGDSPIVWGSAQFANE